MKRFIIALMTVIASHAMASTAFAAVYCSGTVANLTVKSGGDVMVLPSWRNDYITLCNLNTTRGTVAPAVCAGWFTALRSAVTNQENTLTSYPGSTACASIPTYSNSPTPDYFMLLD